MAYDVFGMCNALYDLQAEIPDEILQELEFQKGGMFLIEEEQQRALASHVYAHIVNAAPGGSGANTMIGVALLGGSACYTGKVGDDEHGRSVPRSRHQVPDAVGLDCVVERHDSTGDPDTEVTGQPPGTTGVLGRDDICRRQRLDQADAGVR